MSHSYGYGLLDAGSIVALAQNWTTVAPQHQCIHTILTEPRSEGWLPSLYYCVCWRYSMASSKLTWVVLKMKKFLGPRVFKENLCPHQCRFKIFSSAWNCLCKLSDDVKRTSNQEMVTRGLRTHWPVGSLRAHYPKRLNHRFKIQYFITMSTLSIIICLIGLCTLTRETTHSPHYTMRLSGKLKSNNIQSVQQ